MPVSIRGTSDEVLERIAAALGRYAHDHTAAEVHIVRSNPVSVRVRIADPDFARWSRVDRHETVWKYFNSLADDDVEHVSQLLLMTPDESARSAAGVEFDESTNDAGVPRIG